MAPKDRKCPADVVGNAVPVMRIATGEEDEEGWEEARTGDPMTPSKWAGAAETRGLKSYRKNNRQLLLGKPRKRLGQK